MARPGSSPLRRHSGPPVCRRRALLAALAPLPWGCASARQLRLAGHPWPGYEPMFLARAMGWLPATVELVESASLQDTLALTRQGRIDGAMLTLDEVLQLRDQGHALRVVLVFDVSRGADVLLVRPEIRSLAALRGRRIGVEDTALGTLMLTLVLERAGLRRQDVVVHRIDYQRHETAWRGQEVDAVITYEPVAGRLGALGARALLSTRQLPDTIFDVLAVRTEALQTQGEQLRAGLAAYFRALGYLRQNPWDAAYRVAPRLQVSAEGLIDSLRGLELPDRIGNRRYLADEDSPLLQAARRLSPIMQQAGLLKQPVDTRNLVSSAFLPPS